MPARQRLDPHDVPCLRIEVAVIEPCHFVILSPQDVNIILKVFLVGKLFIGKVLRFLEIYCI